MHTIIENQWFKYLPHCRLILIKKIMHSFNQLGSSIQLLKTSGLSTYLIAD